MYAMIYESQPTNPSAFDFDVRCVRVIRDQLLHVFGKYEL